MADTSSDAGPTATALREEGNALYKSGKVSEACLKYLRARKLAPNDSLPCRNASAALYELGNYKACINTSLKALNLLEAEAGDDVEVQKQKLEQRIAKAEVHNYKASGEDKLQGRKRLLRDIPRYRPSTFNAPENFSVGHDTVTSLFEPITIETFKPDLKEVSFFFGGVGDARNVLQTLIDIADQEKTKKAVQRSYHVTVNDIARCAIARNLIVWILLDDLSEANSESNEASMLLNTIFFIYISTMMPPYAFNQLNSTIDRALDALKKGQQPLKWLYLHEEDIPKYVEALEDWKGRANNIFTNTKITEKVSSNTLTAKLQVYNTQFKVERQMYSSAAVLYPSKEVLQHCDPEMLELIENHSSKSISNVSLFVKHVQEHWRFNITLLDIQYLDKLQGKEEDFDLGFDPFKLEIHFPADEMVTKPSNPDRLFDHMSPFFTEVANAIKFLGGRLQVEAILGDYIDIAEQIHFGLYSDSPNDTGTGYGRLRPNSFPTQYDRVHLSNVPDYVGGHLSTFLYALPLCRRCPSIFIKACCLRNSSSFDNVEDYLSEYQLITDDNTLRQLSQTLITVRENTDLPWPMADYTYYTWSSLKSHIYSELLPRGTFTRWFYGLFFRWALPFKQNPKLVREVILSPLNLTIIFRVISHLQTLGYPSHWLSEPLANIINDNVVTTARPPRTTPMKPANVNRSHPEKKLCTAPFAHEMATLAAFFQPLLPFTVTSPLVPKVNSIYKYTFHLPRSMPHQAQSSSLALLFINNRLVAPLGDTGLETIVRDIRAALDPSWGEVNSSVKGPKWETFREKGLIIWTTFTWDVYQKKASAWMPENLVNGVLLKEEGWGCGLYRTDIWVSTADVPASVARCVSKGEKWEK